VAVGSVPTPSSSPRATAAPISAAPARRTPPRPRGREPPDDWSQTLSDISTTTDSAADSRARALIAARAADDKQGSDIVGLDVGEILTIVDWFVITSAGNPRQVRTIAEEVEAQVKAHTGEGPLRVEGMDDARWVLLDFGDVVVHVFLEEVRAFYQLERLWGDVARLPWSPEVPAGSRSAASD
jgi:ribosome-associated protein